MKRSTRKEANIKQRKLREVTTDTETETETATETGAENGAGNRPEADENEQRSRLDRMSRSPGKCPLSNCEQMVFPSNFLVHCLHKHSCTGHTRTAEIFDHEPVRLRFDPREFQFQETNALAILMYGGTEEKPETLPGLRFISFPNAALMNERRRFEHHLPLMMLICKTTWYALLPDKRLEQELVALNSDNAEIYVLWLVSPILTKKIYYTMTIFNSSYVHSRSVIRLVRNFTHSQNPSDFLHQEQDYMILRDIEVRDFLRSNGPINDGKGLHLELIVHERPDAGLTSLTKIKYLTESTDIDSYEQQHYNTNLLRMPRIKSKKVLGKLSRKPIPTVSTYVQGTRSPSQTTQSSMSEKMF